ncbi:hypothetical protein ACVWWC_001806, partial [Thermostichus sp. MS-CIW-32]
FKCGHCGWEGDADWNGANMIAKLGAAVNQPRGPWLACQLQGYRNPPCTAKQSGPGSLLWGSERSRTRIRTGGGTG